MCIRDRFNGMRWFVEGDIKGCFDNIDHSVLVGLIHSKIKDAQMCIRDRCKAGTDSGNSVV